MRKLLLLFVAVAICSCQPSPNQEFDDVIKEVTGKRVSYDKDFYNAFHNDTTEYDIFIYFLEDYGDNTKKLSHDFCYLAFKIDSIMTRNYDCTLNTYQLSKFEAINEAIRNGDDDYKMPFKTDYRWWGKKAHAEIDLVDYKSIRIEVTKYKH